MILTCVSVKAIAKATDLLALQLPIIYHEPPDFSQIRARDAIKHVFDSVNCKVHASYERRESTSCSNGD